MSKIIERIEAFIRLANNNPSEHEANSAARKACKMIAENKLQFSLGSHVKTTKSTQTYEKGSWERPSNSYGGFYSFWEEINKQKERADAENRRREEARHRKEQAEEEQRKRENKQRENNNAYREQFRGTVHEYAFYDEVKDFDFNKHWGKHSPEADKIFYDIKEKIKRETERPYTSYHDKTKKREFRSLKCKKCKQTKETRFVGLPELYECSDCQWSEWTEKR